MAEKMSTIILKVDLECRRCYKKISKTICKIQEKMNIQAITFNEKNNTVTLSGPFDPKKVCKKLCANACKVIKDIEIKDDKEKPKETKPAEQVESKKDKPKETKQTESAEPKKDKPKDAKPAEGAETKKDKPKDAKPADKPNDAKPVEATETKKDKPKDAKPAEAAETKNDKPKEVKFKDSEPKDTQNAYESVRSESFYIDQPVQGYEPVWARPACGCQGYYGNNRGCYCGTGYGWVQQGPPQVVYGAPAYYGGYNKPDTYFCEEDPQSCRIM